MMPSALQPRLMVDSEYAGDYFGAAYTCYFTDAFC